MTLVALVVTTIAALFLVVGTPLALLVRRRDDGWFAFLNDAVIIGAIISTLTLTVWDWLAWGGVIPLVLAVLATVVVAVRQRRSFPTLRRASRPRALTLVLLGVLVLALVLRLHNVNFILWVGDMGAYVNWANEFVRIGELRSSWPPLYSLFLAIPSAIFGPALTTAVVPLTGLLLISGTIRLLGLLRMPAGIGVAVAALMAVNVHLIWYSSMPASESLLAPVLLFLLTGIVAVLRSRPGGRAWWLVSIAMTMLALGLLRGTGPLLLVPLIVVGVFCLTIAEWKKWALPLWQVIAASMIGALGSYWYGISVIRRYYVTIQIHELMPAPLYRFLMGAGMFEPTVVTALVLVIVLGAVTALGLLLARRTASSPATAGIGGRVVVAGLAGALALVVLISALLNALMFGVLVRAGLWITLLAIVGIALQARRSADPFQRLVAVLLGGTGAMFYGLQIIRLGGDHGHSVHLYWDRYLVSEVLPIWFVLASFGIAALVQVVGRSEAWKRLSDRARRRAAVGLPLVLITAVTALTIPALVLVSSDTYLRGAFAIEQQLADEVTAAGAPTVLWSNTTGEQLDGFFFPNTWMAFAVPLSRTFGIPIANVTQADPNFGPDPVVDDETILAALGCPQDEPIVVLEIDAGGDRLDERLDPGLGLRHLSTVTGSISLLAQPAESGWTHLPVSIDVWEVTGTGGQEGCRS